MRLASLAIVNYATLSLCGAQIYDFDRVATPPLNSLQGFYVFFVFAPEEAPSKQGDAGPSVEFMDFVLSGGDSAGVQVSLVKYKDFVDMVNPTAFCSNDAALVSGQAQAAGKFLLNSTVAEAFVHTVPSAAPQQKTVRHGIRKTGVYALVLTNCGKSAAGVVSGRVVVTNAYGYLPANEYAKMPFYSWLIFVYLALVLVWGLLSLRWWTVLFNIQKCIGVVVLVGLIECIVWRVFLADWNANGRRGRILFVLAVQLSVAKSVFSYMLVLGASLGWGVTRPFLNGDTVWKIKGLSILYIILDTVRQCVMALRHSHSISLLFVMLCLVPVSVMNGIIFSWVFTALSDLMSSLHERRQTEKLVLFQQLWRILIVSISLAGIAMLMQAYDLSKDISTRWQHQWIFTDAISHLIFVAVLICMMYLWGPHSNSQRLAYSEQLDDDVEGCGAAVFAAEDDLAAELEDDDDSFWAATRPEKKPGAEKSVDVDVIGKPSDGPQHFSLDGMDDAFD